MSIRSTVLAAAVLALSCALGACDDDDTVTPPPLDTTPPTVTGITAVDEYHINVIFNEQVTESSAEDPTHYFLTESGTPIRASAAYAPGDTILIASAVLNSDKKTVTVSTYDTMDGLNCNLAVQGVADTHGNDITTPVERLFTGSSNPDETPPAIASRSPLPDATGVSTNAVITVQFTEPVALYDIAISRSGTPVSTTIEQLDATTFRLEPLQLLQFNTLYTVDVDASDAFANAMAHAQWSFRTLASTDNTPPTLVSTSPANNAVNVDVNTNLSMTFSEAIDQSEFDMTLLPDPGAGTTTWSNGGKTVTFNPGNPLIADQQYVMSVAPGYVLDFVGNSIVGVQLVVFSTGSTLASGGISGTVSGHPGSEADDPTGATVMAVDNVNGPFNTFATATVAANNTYSLPHLAPGTYYVLAILPTNDPVLDPAGGDAYGGYGIDIDALDFTAQSVVVAGGEVVGIDFSLHDPSAITGTVTYSGEFSTDAYPVYVGLFDAAGFDPENPGDPAASGSGYWPSTPAWTINTLMQPVPMGDYYVGAFLDATLNGSYDAGQDPVGLYGGLALPTSIHIMNGNDVGGLTIALQDPVPGSQSRTTAWSKPAPNPLLERLYEIARRGQSMAK